MPGIVGDFSDANRATLSMVAETSMNVPPASPTMRRLRGTGYSPQAQKRVYVSREIRPDAMVAGSAVVGRSNTGAFDFELSCGGDFDPLIEALLRGTFVAPLVVTSVSVLAGNKFGKTAAFGNVQVGQWVQSSGFTNAGNNGWFKVTAKSADDMTVAGTLATEGATASTRVRGSTLQNGIVKRSFALEMAYLDVAQFFMFTGARWGSTNLSLTAEQPITGTANFMGIDVLDAGIAFAGGYTAPTAADIVTASENLGTIKIADAALSTAVRSVTLNIDNKLRNQSAAGQSTPAGIAYGSQTITGRMEVYFKDRSLYTQAMAHGSVALELPVVDTKGNGLHFYMPNIKLGEPQMPVTGQDSDVMQAFDFQAFPDVTTGLYQIQVDAAHA